MTKHSQSGTRSLGDSRVSDDSDPIVPEKLKPDGTKKQ